jgi:hypothetical protein
MVFRGLPGLLGMFFNPLGPISWNKTLLQEEAGEGETEEVQEATEEAEEQGCLGACRDD